MRFMNRWDIEQAALDHRDHPILGPATTTLANLMDWTDAHSDGWPYWPKPARAAARLMALIHHAESQRWSQDALARTITVAEYRAALRPIKAFRTRQNADFEIVEAQ